MKSIRSPNSIDHRTTQSSNSDEEVGNCSVSIQAGKRKLLKLSTQSPKILFFIALYCWLQWCHIWHVYCLVHANVTLWIQLEWWWSAYTKVDSWLWRIITRTNYYCRKAKRGSQEDGAQGGTWCCETKMSKFITLVYFDPLFSCQMMKAVKCENGVASLCGKQK